MFKGTTKECLAHAASTLEYEKLRSAIISFVGASSHRVREWLGGKGFPKGLYLVKLRLFLVDQGYDCSDFKSLPTELKQLNYLVGYGIVSLSEVNERLGYHDEYEVLRLLTVKGRNVSGVRKRVLNVLYREKKESIEPDRHGAHNIPHTIPSKTTAMSEPVENTTLSEMLLGMKAFIALTTPIIEEMLQASPEERRQFRQEIGTQRLFEFSNNLHRFSELVNALCSEKAREVSGVNNSKLTKKEG